MHNWSAGLIVFVAASGAVAAEPPGGATDRETATHREVAPIRPTLGPAGKLETIAMDRHGRLLAGVSWMPEPADGRPRQYAIQVLSPAGDLLATWSLPDGVEARMLHAAEDGEVYAGGDRRLARLNAVGELVQQLAFDQLLDGRYANAHSSGLTANGQYLFLAVGHGHSLKATEDVVRLNRDLTEPVLLAESQYGCCSHIDLECRSGELLIAENSRHRVNRLTFDGELIKRWGKRDRVGLEGFAACCNPVNFDLGPDGVLYTAESGLGRVKKYTPQGEFLGLVGYVDTTEYDGGSRLASISCYIPIEVSADGRQLYVMDVRQNLIRVLE